MSLRKAGRRKAYESKSGDLPEVRKTLPEIGVLCVVKTLRSKGDENCCMDVADRNLRYCLVCVRSVPLWGQFFIDFLMERKYIYDKNKNHGFIYPLGVYSFNGCMYAGRRYIRTGHDYSTNRD